MGYGFKDGGDHFTAEGDPPDFNQHIKKCSCGKPGRDRFDNGLKCGVHCQDCWEEMIYRCRSRSW